MAPPNQHDRREATRTALIAAARELFGSRRFSDVPADEIVAAAGVTRGALHYHFDDKRGLFQAVFEEVEVEIANELSSLVIDGETDRLRHALTAFLDICERPEVVRIALTEAPAVLGWKTWREIESRHGLGLLTVLLAEGRAADAIPTPQILAQLLLGSVIEGALLIAEADPRNSRAQVEESLVAAFGTLLRL